MNKISTIIIGSIILIMIFIVLIFAGIINIPLNLTPKDQRLIPTSVAMVHDNISDILQNPDNYTNTKMANVNGIIYERTYPEGERGVMCWLEDDTGQIPIPGLICKNNTDFHMGLAVVKNICIHEIRDVAGVWRCEWGTALEPLIK
jgi:hypothetical protein